jgi:hypothetical protein
MTVITFMYVSYTNLLTKWWTFMELSTVNSSWLETLIYISIL